MEVRHMNPINPSQKRAEAARHVLQAAFGVTNAEDAAQLEGAMKRRPKQAKIIQRLAEHAIKQAEVAKAELAAAAELEPPATKPKRAKQPKSAPAKDTSAPSPESVASLGIATRNIYHRRAAERRDSPPSKEDLQR